MSIMKSFIKNKNGLSLVELIVTIAILSIVSIGIGAAVVSSTKSYTSGSAEVDLQQEAQNITNILTNIVMDANAASNKILEGESLNDAGADALYVESSKGETGVSDKIYIWMESSGDGRGTLKYRKNNDMVYVLSNAIESFEAKPGKKNGNWDYTVDFNIVFKSKVVGAKAPDREFKTSFLVMSRNGNTIRTDKEDDTPVIIVNNEAVIEPNQEIEIPFDVLFSGNKDVKKCSIELSDWNDVECYYCYKDNDSGDEITYDTDLSNESFDNESKRIKIKANYKLSEDFTIDIVVKNKNKEVKQTVKVYVRRVLSVTDGDWVDNQSSEGTPFMAGSVYTMKPKINYKDASLPDDVTNPDRFFYLSLDDDYVSPWPVRVRLVKCEKYSPSDLEITVYDESSVSSFSKNVGEEFDLSEGQYFNVRLNKDMDKTGACIEFDAFSPHAALFGMTEGDLGDTAGSAENKTNICYDLDAHKTYTIKLVESLFPKSSKFKRGADNEEPSFSEKFPSSYEMLNIYAESFYLPYLQETYKNDSTPFVAPGGTITTRKNYFCNMLDKDKLVGMLNGKISFSAFYTIGSTEIPDDPVKNINYYRNEGGHYWSQYRIMSGKGGSKSYHLTKPNDRDEQVELNGGDSDSPGALRLDPDKEYDLEFISVLYNEGSSIRLFNGLETIESKSILWPKYDKMMDLGFGDVHNGAGFVFDNNAEKATGDFPYFYAEVYPVKASRIEYRNNEGLLKENGLVVSALDESIGSAENPIILGSGLSESFVYFKQIEWDGLATNAYMNRANGIVQYNNGGGWLTVVNDLNSDVPIPIAGIQMKVIGPEGKVKFQNYSENSMDLNTTFRFIPTIKQYKYYIKDSEGIFSRKVYGDSNNGNKYTFAYPGNIGYVYFKKYGNPVTITLDANGGNLINSSFVIYEGQNLPDIYSADFLPSFSGYSFLGWYTSADGGDKVESVYGSYPYSVLGNSTTLYAHWEKSHISASIMSTELIWGNKKCTVVLNNDSTGQPVSDFEFEVSVPDGVTNAWTEGLSGYVSRRSSNTVVIHYNGTLNTNSTVTFTLWLQ